MNEPPPVSATDPDDLAEDDYYEFARANSVARGGTFTAPDAWASTHWPKRDADKVVREWKQNREAELAGRRVEEEKRVPLRVAAQYVKSLRDAGHPPDYLRRYVEQYEGLADEDRLRLLEEFCPEESAAARGSP